MPLSIEEYSLTGGLVILSGGFANWGLPGSFFYKAPPKRENQIFPKLFGD